MSRLTSRLPFRPPSQPRPPGPNDGQVRDAPHLITGAPLFNRDGEEIFTDESITGESNDRQNASSRDSDPRSQVPNYYSSTSSPNKKVARESAIYTPISSSPPEGGEERLVQYGYKALTWVSVVLLYILGIATAIGHHVFLSHIDGKEYSNPLWLQRYSLVLANAAKISFVACVEFAFGQVVWDTIRHRGKGVSLDGIDSLFSVVKHAIHFLTVDMWVSAPLAAMLATVAWTLPLIALVTPTTLTVAVAVDNTTAVCQNPAPNLNFGDEFGELGEDYNNNWKQGRDYQFVKTGLFTIQESARNPYSIYRGLTTSTVRIATLTAYGGEPLRIEEPPCGAQNCTFSISFNGPAWRCNDTAIDDKRAPWLSNATDHNIHTGLNNDDIGWLNKQNRTAGGLFFRTFANVMYSARRSSWDPYFWLTHATTKFPSEGPWDRFPDELRDNKTRYDFLNSFDVEQFFCQPWNTTYTVDIAFLQGKQQPYSVRKLDYLNPAPLLGTFGQPASPDWPFKSLQYQAMFYSLSDLLKGNLISNAAFSGGIKVIENSNVLSIPGVTDQVPLKYNNFTLFSPNAPKRRMRKYVEELSRNFTLSMLSQQQMDVNFMDHNVQCTTSITSIRWKYHPRDLILSYAIAAFVSLLALVLGAAVIVRAGFIAETGFKGILFTTRNSELDELVKGNCLASEILAPKELGKVRLRFGEVNRPSGISYGDFNPGGEKVRHTAFGTIGSISRMHKKTKYA